MTGVTFFTKETGRTVVERQGQKEVCPRCYRTENYMGIYGNTWTWPSTTIDFQKEINTQNCPRCGGSKPQVTFKKCGHDREGEHFVYNVDYSINFPRPDNESGIVCSNYS